MTDADRELATLAPVVGSRWRDTETGNIWLVVELHTFSTGVPGVGVRREDRPTAWFRLSLGQFYDGGFVPAAVTPPVPG